MIDKLFIKLYNFFATRRQLLFFMFAAVFAFSFLIVKNISFNEDISDFLPNSGKYSQVSKFISQAAGNSKIFIYFYSKDSVFDANNIKKSMDFFEKTAKQNNKNGYFNNLLAKTDQNKIANIANFVQQNIAFFADDTLYNRIDSCLENSTEILNNSKNLIQQPLPTFVKQTIANDPLNIFTPVLSGLKSFNPTSNYSVDNGYIFDNQYNRGVIFFNSPAGMSESGSNAEIVSQLEKIIDTTKQEFQNVDIQLFGPPIIAVCNANRIKKDTLLTSIVSTLLILVVLWFSIRNVKNLIITALTLLFSVLTALAVSKIVFGEISLIAVGISAVFTGIALNYPLHFVTHFYHTKGDMQLNLTEIVSPLTTGNITTVAAFYSLMFADSPALKHLGFMGGTILISCIFITLVLLPHIVDYKEISVESNNKNGFDFLFNFLQKKIVVIIALVLTPILIYLGLKTDFDGNMHNLNYMTQNLSTDMQRLLNSQSSNQTTAVYVVSTGNDVNQVLENHEIILPLYKTFLNDGTVENISGIGNFLPSEKMQIEKLNRWNKFLSSYKDTLIDVIDNFNEKNNNKNLFSNFKNIINHQPKTENLDFFSPLISLVDGGFFFKTADENAIVSILHVKKENVSFVENKLNALNDNICAFDENVVSNQLVETLNNNFNFVLYAAGILVFFFLTMSMRSVELAVITFIPLTISWFWILGIMYIVDIKFNIVNIILATFIFGQGDDYAVFITEGLMYEYATKRKVLNSFKRSVAVSSIIMFIGIGSLIFAVHPAMHSLGVVVVIGMFSVVLAAYIFPPLIFNFLIKDKSGHQREYPYNFASIFASLYYFLCFVAACFLLTILLLWLKITRKNDDETQLRFHKKMQKYVNLVHHCPRVKLSIDNSVNETFEKPSIIIANHASALDILCIKSLNNKILFITNDEQQKSFLYGRLLKVANFYPASLGYDVLAQRLKKFIDKGYSVVVFPEGTRSLDYKLHRFHQGAFFLARQLQVDILPIALFGLGNVLKKGDLLLRPGQIFIKICNRVSCNDKMFAETNLETARNFRHLFIDVLQNMSVDVEKSEYFKPFIIYNYIYKGAEIFSDVKKSMKKKYNFIDNYKNINNKILFKNCSYGQIPLLFALVNKNATVYATDNDENKILIAENCAAVPKNLTFLRNNFNDENLQVIDCNNLPQ